MIERMSDTSVDDDNDVYIVDDNDDFCIYIIDIPYHNYQQSLKNLMLQVKTLEIYRDSHNCSDQHSYMAPIYQKSLLL